MVSFRSTAREGSTLGAQARFGVLHVREKDCFRPKLALRRCFPAVSFPRRTKTDKNRLTLLEPADHTLRQPMLCHLSSWFKRSVSGETHTSRVDKVWDTARRRYHIFAPGAASHPHSRCSFASSVLAASKGLEIVLVTPYFRWNCTCELANFLYSPLLPSF